MTIRCGYGDEKEPRITYEVEDTEEKKLLFCYVGTNILAEYMNHPAPRQTFLKSLPFNLKYGSATVALINKSWFFSGDFDHCEHADIKENCWSMRKLFEKYAPQFSKFQPFCLHKDYDEGLYLYLKRHMAGQPKIIDGIHVSEHDFEWFERFKGKELLPWELLQEHDPPTPAWKLEQQERLEKEHKLCPICANRTYLESLGELQPEVTGNKDLDYHLAMNFEHHRTQGDTTWALNWLLLKNKWEIEHTPKCSECGQPILTPWRFGGDNWVEQTRRGFCETHDAELQRRRADFNYREAMKHKPVSPREYIAAEGQKRM